MDIADKLTHPLFNNLTTTELGTLLQLAKTVEFKIGDVLIREGDIGQIIFVILEGKIDVSKVGDHPGEIIKLARLGAGSLVGEISVITQNPRSATVTALKPTIALAFDIAAIEKDPAAKSLYEKMLQNLTIELSKKLVYTRNKIVRCETNEQYEAAAKGETAFYTPNSIALLFGWKWTDVMHEAPFLAEHGYDAIKLFPPQEFVTRAGNPWWTIYQPVSYKLSDFYGTEEEFIAMIDFCHSYDIKIYIDLVLNHMAEFCEDETQHSGTNGTNFARYQYGPLNDEGDYYDYNDFYHFDVDGNKQITNDDYSRLENVWHLEHYDLVRLPKLNTDRKRVIKILRKYAEYLLHLGVDGFRIDAAKHISATAVEKILAGLRTRDGLKPFVYQEYYTGAPMGIDVYSYMEKYFNNGYVTSFQYGSILADAINNGANNLQKLIEFTFGSSWIHYPENRTVVVIDNHDTERMMPNMLNYKSTANNAYVLAYVFMLSWSFGVPKIMSSFHFNSHNDPIPNCKIWQNDRNTCFDPDSLWVAQHRWRAIANMVLFRNKTRDAPGISHVWVNGNQVAFARTFQKHKEFVATRGYVVINATAELLKHRFETGLPAGRYYDLISSDLVEGKMQGPTINVEDYGFATIEVRPFDAVVVLIDYVA